MPKEQEGQGVPLTSIHINLTDRSIEFESEQGAVARLTFASSGVIFFHPGPQTIDQGPEVIASPELPGIPETSEKERTMTLSGKLLTKPKEGRKDRSNKPTSYARFAAHEEGEESAHIFLATFHRHTARIALGLPRGAQVTVEGYPHPSDNPKRMDTFSVVNIPHYPGRPARTQK